MLRGKIAAPCSTSQGLSRQRGRGIMSGMSALTPVDLAITDLGVCRHASPISSILGERAMHYVGEADRVLLDDRLSYLGTHRGLIAEMPAFELAGPRNKIFFEPGKMGVGIVTCGGLC